jgi:mannose-6-phosphate isomerase-like protein (cupin superfamily)
MDGYMTPPNHKGFRAKKLFQDIGRVKWGAVAHFENGGGGPEGNHTHEEDHIFIVVEGEVRVVMGDGERVAGRDEIIFVDGAAPHSIWNNATERLL